MAQALLDTGGEMKAELSTAYLILAGNGEPLKGLKS